MRSFCLFFFLTTILLSGCASPEPHRFVDAPDISSWEPKSYEAIAEGNTLILKVRQQPGLNIYDFEISRYEDSLYIIPRRISSGGSREQTFSLDLTKHNPTSNWPDHVYWWGGKASYPLLFGRVPPESDRPPLPRKKIQITRR